MQAGASSAQREQVPRLEIVAQAWRAPICLFLDKLLECCTMTSLDLCITKGFRRSTGLEQLSRLSWLRANSEQASSAQVLLSSIETLVLQLKMSSLDSLLR